MRSAIVLTLLAGCAAATPRPAAPHGMSRQQQPFPSADEVFALTQRPPPAIPGTDIRFVDAWTLEGPSGGKEGAPYDDASPWGGLVAETVASRKGALGASNALRCTAHELGLFVLANMGMPAEPVRRHMLGVCGSTLPSAGVETLRADVPPSMTDAQVFAQASSKVRARLATLAGAHQVLGLSYARKNDRMVVAWVYGTPLADIVPSSSTIAADRTAVVRGTNADPSLQLRAVVNQGTFGVAACTPLGEAAPRFAMRCPIAAGDHAAWIELSAAAKGAYLGRTIATVLANDGDGSTLGWASLAAKKAKPVTSPTEVSSTILADLNAIRAVTGASPLVLVPPQSATNAAVAPHFQSAAMSGDLATWEKIALGVMAGWDVKDATISSANVSSALFGAAIDGSTWLEFVLAQPTGRAALLDRGATRVAIGSLIDPTSKSVAALVTTYATFSATDHAAEIALVEKRIASERVAKGLDPGAKIAGLEGLAAEANRVTLEGKDPIAALDAALQDAVTRTQRSMRGTVWAVNDFELVPLPEPLLTKPNMPFAVQVAHRREKGAAWGEWIVMIVWADV